MDVINRSILNTPPSAITGQGKGTDTIEVAKQKNYDGHDVKTQKVSDELFKGMARGERANMYSRTIVPLVGNRTDDIMKSGGFSNFLFTMSDGKAYEAANAKEYGISSKLSTEGQAIGSLRTGGGTCGNISSLVFLYRAAEGHDLQLQRFGWEDPENPDINHAFTVEGPDKYGMCAIYDSYGSEPSVHLMPYSTLVKSLDAQNYRVLDQRDPNPDGDPAIDHMLRTETAKGLYSGAQHFQDFSQFDGGYERHCLKMVATSGHMYDVAHFREDDAPVLYINESTQETSTFSKMSQPLYALLHTSGVYTDNAAKVEEAANAKHDVNQLAQHVMDHELIVGDDVVLRQPSLLSEDSDMSDRSDWGGLSFADYRHEAHALINAGQTEQLRDLVENEYYTDELLTSDQESQKLELLTRIRSELADPSVEILNQDPRLADDVSADDASIASQDADHGDEFVGDDVILPRQSSRLSEDSNMSVRSDWGGLSFADYRHEIHALINADDADGLRNMLAYAFIDGDLLADQGPQKDELLTLVRTKLDDQSIEFLTEDPEQ
ncbi:hypothetical protein [Thalassomonas actiniarum]|uniref:Uncharacterized protein n=1 Tax=Thalassomonas actiniarum TaxID=485447 RepID=A0AAE9YH98_9GAMM|nr:hypothetical protein [Thalassomonas actiniarum]WDD96605.1 hypothetical protein SG35_014575 [Thalassomonas actiniarum]